MKEQACTCRLLSGSFWAASNNQQGISIMVDTHCPTNGKHPYSFQRAFKHALRVLDLCHTEGFERCVDSLGSSR